MPARQRSNLQWLFLASVATAACTEKEFKEPFKLADRTTVDGKTQQAVIDPKTLNDGHNAFTHYCYGCHGEQGDGHGPASYAMRPPPRDFRQGLFKFAGVASGQLPTDDALDRTIRRGLHGTPMLAWDVPPVERRAIIQYIKTFKYPSADKSRWQQEEPGQPLQVGPDPWKGRVAEAIEFGKQMYHVAAGGAGCAGCHDAYVTRAELVELYKKLGAEPPTEFAPEMYRMPSKATEFLREVDDKGEPAVDANGEPKRYTALPPDFLINKTKTVWPLGSKVDGHEYTDELQRHDLYVTIGAGIGGAAMPMWKGALSPDNPAEDDKKLWSLAYYVQSLVNLRETPAAVQLRRKLDAQGPAPGGPAQ